MMREDSDGDSARRGAMRMTIDMRGAFVGSGESMRALADACGRLAREHFRRGDDDDPPAALMPA
jgi:hypothetical protein